MSVVVTKEKAVIKQVTVSGMIIRYVLELADGSVEYADTLEELGELVKRLV